MVSPHHTFRVPSHYRNISGPQVTVGNLSTHTQNEAMYRVSHFPKNQGSLDCAV